MCFLPAVSQMSRLTHPNLKLKWTQRDNARERGIFILERVAPSERSLMVNDSSLATMACALLERMYYCKVNNHFLPPPQPKTEYVFRTLRPFRNALCRKLGRYSTRVSTESFVSMYSGRKRANYEQAVEEYHTYGVQRSHSHSVMFVKMEKVNPNKAPRCIQPRHRVYNVALGVYLKPVEHTIYRKIAKVFGSDTPVVFKGLNTVEMGVAMRAKWEMFPNPVAVGLDATKFDMHVSSSMLKWEHSIYMHMFGDDPELGKLLGWQLYNTGRGFAHDGSLSYSVKGRRFSGDMNTALGNCVIMCGLIYCWARSRGVDIQLANNGDDAVAIMNQEDEAKFMKGLEDWFLLLGFRMEVENPVSVFEEIEFCQMHPVLVGGVPRMVRNFNSAREKDSICLLRIGKDTDWYKWLLAVGECGLALTSGVPVVQSYYQAMCRSGISSKMNEASIMQSGMMMLSRGMESKASVVLDCTRLSFFRAFGVTPCEQMALESYYDSLHIRFGAIEAIDNLEQVEPSPF